MEELIFYGVIALFVVIDALIKGAKKKQRPDGVPEPTGWEEEPWEPVEDQPPVATYDQDASYDDYLERDTGTLSGYQPRTEPARPQPTSSESMIPADIWEEIQARARGEAPRRPDPAPAPEPDPPPRHVPAPRAATRVRPGQSLHLAHAGYGTDPSSRRRSAEDGLDPLRASLSADAAKARALLRANDANALRQAIILQEILSPPLALRDE